MKTIFKKGFSSLLIVALLLSVSVTLVGCSNDDSFTAGTYEYESLEFNNKIYGIFMSVLDGLGLFSGGIDDFLSMFDNETITFSVSESDSNSGEICVNDPYEFSGYTGEFKGVWAKDGDQITATLYNDFYIAERVFEFEDGYLIMIFDADELGTIKVKYKQVKWVRMSRVHSAHMFVKNNSVEFS